MNAKKRLLGGLAATLALAIGAALLFAGGFGFFKAPVFETELTLDTPPDAVEITSPDPVRTAPCNGQSGPIEYYANDPSAAQYNNFGPPLDPTLSPLDNPQDPEPDVRQIVDSFWERLCRDPALTRAVVAAAFPTWDKLDVDSFEWTPALEQLATINWDEAELVYYTEPPTPWTMMMKHGDTADDYPITYITSAHHAGWYLDLTVDGNTLLLRLGCGGQPSLDIEEGAQAALDQVFQVS